MTEKRNADHRAEVTAEEGSGVARPERLQAFSDGVFAIAITLLVLNLAPPDVQHHLWSALLKLWPAYLSYVLSFVIIGIIWAQHHEIFRYIRRTDHAFILINVVFLLWVAFLPFPTAILARYLQSPTEQQVALSLYTGTFLVGALPFNLLWRYAARNGRLLYEGVSPRTIGKITRSYNIGPVLYLVDFCLSFVSVPLSLILFFLVAIFYAVAPLPAVDRLMDRRAAGDRRPAR